MNQSSKGHTVLVAEDDWLLRQEIVEGLQNIGWIVLEAATGAGALTLKEANTIHLLITDIQLADAVTGWDIAEAFRVWDPKIPVIYTSGNPSNNRRRVSESVFLSKPVAMSELTLACRNLVAG
jgi:CheY-like chemotaxis protein